MKDLKFLIFFQCLAFSALLSTVSSAPVNDDDLLQEFNFDDPLLETDASTSVDVLAPSQTSSEEDLLNLNDLLPGTQPSEQPNKSESTPIIENISDATQAVSSNILVPPTNQDIPTNQATVSNTPDKTLLKDMEQLSSHLTNDVSAQNFIAGYSKIVSDPQKLKTVQDGIVKMLEHLPKSSCVFHAVGTLAQLFQVPPVKAISATISPPNDYEVEIATEAIEQLKSEVKFLSEDLPQRVAELQKQLLENVQNTSTQFDNFREKAASLIQNSKAGLEDMLKEQTKSLEGIKQQYAQKIEGTVKSGQNVIDAGSKYWKSALEELSKFSDQSTSEINGRYEKFIKEIDSTNKSIAKDNMTIKEQVTAYSKSMQRKN